MTQIVRLTKNGGVSGRCLPGGLDEGTVLDVKVPDEVAAKGEQEAKVRARRMMGRDLPGESPLEWEAVVVDRLDAAEGQGRR